MIRREEVFRVQDICPEAPTSNPYAVVHRLCKLEGDEPVLIPEISTDYYFIPFSRFSRRVYTIQFVRWFHEEIEGVLEIEPKAKWRLEQLFSRYPIVYFHRGKQAVLHVKKAPTTRAELARANLKALTSVSDPVLDGNFLEQYEVIEDMMAQSLAEQKVEFWLRVPRSAVFDVTDDEKMLEEERNRPEARIMTSDALNMIQPEYTDTPPLPVKRFGTTEIKFFQPIYKLDPNGQRIRTKKGRFAVERTAKSIGEEFAYKHGVPIYSYDFNETGAKGYFCATDELIKRMYERPDEFKKAFRSMFRDLTSAECISEVLMYRWGGKLYADLEVYYEFNQHADGKEDDWTWRSVDFFNEQLAAICGIEGVQRESWTILTSDSRRVEDGKVLGKVSRHALCQDPRVFFRSMMDIQIFYEVANETLGNRIAAGDETLKFMDIMNEKGTAPSRFWDTGVVTFFRCFRMLGNDKFGKGRPLKFHAGCKPENLELACLIQRPFGGTYEHSAEFIQFRVDGRKALGNLKFDYDEENKLISIFVTNSQKRKNSVITKSVRQREKSSKQSTVPDRIETVTMDWLRTSEIGRPWNERGSLDDVCMKQLQPFMYLIALPKVNCYCYQLAQRGEVADPIHNSGAVSLYIIKNKNGSGASLKQKCQTGGKCPSGFFWLGRIPEHVFEVLFGGK